ncbi:MAG: hypothetical protein K2X26_07065 [Chitinophagaceae bacterium]|nr:hypothetical protein [Chitinophagaceae bacterium]
MDYIFFLRSYGDFVVALYALKTKSNRQFNLIASSHLEPVYKAIQKAVNWAVPPVTFIDINIKKGLLSAFTNKFFFRFDAFKELQLLSKYINTIKQTDPEAIFWVEQRRRKKWLEMVTHNRFQSIHSNHRSNIYDSYNLFFNHGRYDDFIEAAGAVTQSIIFPDSRLTKKQIPEKFISHILSKAAETEIEMRVARFNKEYKNFEELVLLIKNAEFIISADSLPAHLAQYIGIPHFICYTKKLNKEWITPFARELTSYSIPDKKTKRNNANESENITHLFS